MKCPKCGATENINFFLRHQSKENDDSIVANCITIIHADPECGYNQSYLIADCLDYIFPEWSEIPDLMDRLNAIEDSVSFFNVLSSFREGVFNENLLHVEAEVLDEKNIKNSDAPAADESEVEIEIEDDKHEFYVEPEILDEDRTNIVFDTIQEKEEEND